jgi:hypothetical protein
MSSFKQYRTAFLIIPLTLNPFKKAKKFCRSLPKIVSAFPILSSWDAKEQLYLYPPQKLIQLSDVKGTNRGDFKIWKINKYESFLNCW